MVNIVIWLCICGVSALSGSSEPLPLRKMDHCSGGLELTGMVISASVSRDSLKGKQLKWCKSAHWKWHFPLFQPEFFYPRENISIMMCLLRCVLKTVHKLNSSIAKWQAQFHEQFCKQLSYLPYLATFSIWMKSELLCHMHVVSYVNPWTLRSSV